MYVVLKLEMPDTGPTIQNKFMTIFYANGYNKIKKKKSINTKVRHGHNVDFLYMCQKQKYTFNIHIHIILNTYQHYQEEGKLKWSIDCRLLVKEINEWSC